MTKAKNENVFLKINSANTMRKILLLALALMPFLSVQQPVFAQTEQPAHSFSGSLTEEQKVEKLIDYIRTLEGATFIRNNSEYKPEKAADHLASKWQKHGARVKTAENFVQKLASESSNGTPYSIRFADGSVQTTRELLLQALRQLDNSAPKPAQ